MAAFWNSEMGVFFLPTGPIGPTLMDVAMIAHLPVVGEDPALPIQTHAPLLALPMISREEDPTRRKYFPSLPISSREGAPTRKQSLSAPPRDPTPSPPEPAVVGVSSDSEATASQMGGLPAEAADSSFLSEEPIVLSAAAPITAALAATAPIAAAPAPGNVWGAARPTAGNIPPAAVPAAAVQVAPDSPAAAAPGAAILMAAVPIAEAVGRVAEPPAAVLPRGPPQDIEEISSSDSETSVNLGPKSDPQRPFAATEELAIAVPAARPPRPTTLLALSITTVRPERHLDLAPLSAIPILADIQAIFA
ncbi:uncharacterized protein LOC127255166 [Andrographis paniculata]|uniref:uncharacterized protein LOC127255166 n=1 Tax=Andrographis paniculata TaxID=175694 RepID=UPI0021E7D458|nr:uncharacterized protein LOC127255166 [Andrographis paniculata]